MFHIRYCKRCQMPVEPDEKVSVDDRNNVYHDRHSVSSEEAAEVYLKFFASGLFCFGGTASKQKPQ